jgi:hypothetical protein
VSERQRSESACDEGNGEDAATPEKVWFHNELPGFKHYPDKELSATWSSELEA